MKNFDLHAQCTLLGKCPEAAERLYTVSGEERGLGVRERGPRKMFSTTPFQFYGSTGFKYKDKTENCR